MKNYLLMFDDLIIQYGPLDLVEQLMRVLPNGKKDFKEKLEYLELLEKKGLISIFDKEKFKVPKELLSSKKFVTNFIKTLEYYDKLKSVSTRYKENELIELYADFMETDRIAGEFGSRLRSMVFNFNNPSSEYIPIVKNFASNDLNEIETTKSLVLGVVLKNFPIIDSNVEVERIIEFKKAEDIRARYFELRDFVTNLSKQNLKENEIQEKVEYLLNEYKNGLELLDFKYNLSTIETICITTAEVVENIATLKFSKAVKTLFELNKRELKLLEAERELKGREVSYLYKAQKELN
ncbi:MAG: hypothetical protein JJ935_09450 [Muricauda sp.]|nr:hypothetical protein [Allomuricauda sp.]MBO6644871.1 hypothetical protein [Allomuricauda sp.]